MPMIRDGHGSGFNRRLFTILHKDPDFRGFEGGIEFSWGRGTTSVVTDAALAVDRGHSIKDDEDKPFVDAALATIRRQRESVRVRSLSQNDRPCDPPVHGGPDRKSYGNSTGGIDAKAYRAAQRGQ
jgi:hypothetical protein